MSRLRAVFARLRSSDRSIFSQLIRFALSGGVVAAVYLSATLLLSRVVGLDFQVALVLGFTMALMTHFTLQRVFVWGHGEDFALPLNAQVGRYVVVALSQYAITAATTAFLPGPLNTSTEAVYVIVTLMITCLNFIIFRTRIFHSRTG